MEQKEKVSLIACTNDHIYGLTSSGQLTIYDVAAGNWVLRCESDILTVDRANVLKRVEVPTWVVDSGKYVDQDKTPEKIKDDKEIHWAWVVAGLALFLFVINYFLGD